MERKVLYFGKSTLHKESPSGNVVSVETTGFLPHEVVGIHAPTLYEASRLWGEIQKESVQQELARGLSGKTETEKQQLFVDIRFQLDRMKELVDREIFRIDTVDYLARYIESVRGFAEGAGISVEEASLLQAETMAGCQTMIVQDTKTGTVGFVHTEENGSDPNMPDGPYYYKMVRMSVGGKTIQFFGYPGLSGWGAAFGVNESTGMVQLVDDLVVAHDKGLGDLWANALAFMTLDSGKIDEIDIMIKNIQDADPPVLFTGGYAIHCVASGGIPQVRTFEFAGESASLVEPEIVAEKHITVQVNTPRDEVHKPYSLYRMPTYTEEWDEEKAILGLEMERRMERLFFWGKHEHNIVSENPKELLAAGLRILAQPEGDIEEFDGKKEVTGLVSSALVGYATGYIGKEGIQCIFGKKYPPPIPGKEYSIAVMGNRWVKDNLRDLAKEKAQQHKNEREKRRTIKK